MALIEQYNNELYHYGVKGMKWGVRKSRAEIEAARLARYKRSEINTVERRSRLESKRNERVVNRSSRKYDRAINKYGTDSKQAARAEQRLVKAKTNAIVGRKIADAEIKRIGKMSLSDVKDERRRVGQIEVQNMITRRYMYEQYNSGNTRRAYSPYMLPMQDSTKYKTNTRLGTEQLNDIRTKAEREARKSIRR